MVSDLTADVAVDLTVRLVSLTSSDPSASDSFRHGAVVASVPNARAPRLNSRVLWSGNLTALQSKVPECSGVFAGRCFVLLSAACASGGCPEAAAAAGAAGGPGYGLGAAPDAAVWLSEFKDMPLADPQLRLGAFKNVSRSQVNNEPAGHFDFVVPVPVKE